MIDDFITKFTKRIELGLPGAVAHKRMAPAQRVIEIFDESNYPNAEKASVLMLLYPNQQDIFFALIQRPVYDGTHGGQVSFPGGRIEKSDTTPWHTALRESQEEIGLDPVSVNFIAKLSPVYIPPSNFFVHVFTGSTATQPHFIPDLKEVETIIEAPLNILLDEGIKSEMEFTRNTIQMMVPCYTIQGRNVWGATAIILSEVEEILRTM